MKNLNEPRRPVSEDVHATQGDVIPIESRRGQAQETPSLLKREDLRSRWSAIQTHFVDEPRKSVQEADQLVESTIQEIEKVFRDQRTQLESQWSGGKDVSTEDLRQ